MFKFDEAKGEIQESLDNGVTFKFVAKATVQEAKTFLAMAAKKNVISLHETTRQSMTPASIWSPVPGYAASLRAKEAAARERDSKSQLSEAYRKAFNLTESQANGAAGITEISSVTTDKLYNAARAMGLSESAARDFAKGPGR